MTQWQRDTQSAKRQTDTGDAEREGSEEEQAAGGANLEPFALARPHWGCIHGSRDDYMSCVVDAVCFPCVALRSHVFAVRCAERKRTFFSPSTPPGAVCPSGCAQAHESICLRSHLPTARSTSVPLRPTLDRRGKATEAEDGATSAHRQRSGNQALISFDGAVTADSLPVRSTLRR